METRANYVVIGIFGVGTIFAIFLFALWLGKVQLDLEYTNYNIVFDGSVSGLSKGSDVQYNGIKVGAVNDMRLDERDPNKVWVTIEIEARTPVKIDTYAQLVLQGVTGLAFIELTGGTAAAAELVPPEGVAIATIRSKRSAIQELLAAAPDLVAESNLLLLQFSKLASDENIDALTNTIQDVQRVTQVLGESDGEIRELLKNLAIVSDELALASRNINIISGNIAELTDSANTLVSDDAKELFTNLNSAVARVDKLAKGADDMLQENRDAVYAFSVDGLGQMSDLITETRSLVETLDRLARRMEEDPRMVLGGTELREKKVKQ